MIALWIAYLRGYFLTMTDTAESLDGFEALRSKPDELRAYVLGAKVRRDGMDGDGDDVAGRLMRILATPIGLACNSCHAPFAEGATYSMIVDQRGIRSVHVGGCPHDTGKEARADQAAPIFTANVAKAWEGQEVNPIKAPVCADCGVGPQAGRPLVEDSRGRKGHTVCPFPAAEPLPPSVHVEREGEKREAAIRAGVGEICAVADLLAFANSGPVGASIHAEVVEAVQRLRDLATALAKV